MPRPGNGVRLGGITDQPSGPATPTEEQVDGTVLLHPITFSLNTLITAKEKEMAEKIKATWIVCNMEGWPLTGDNDPVEHKTERAAIAAAKKHVKTSEDSEAWIFKLSHVVERPDADPAVIPVK